VTATSWFDAGKAILSWVRSQKEVDPDRVAVRGQSMVHFSAHRSPPSMTG
jgi:hypothetical protein